MNIKWIRRGLIILLVVVASTTVYMIADGVSVQAASGRTTGNPSNYRLVQDRFELGDLPYVLTLQFRGTPITTNTVEWYMVSSSSGVMSASITRINGENVLRFTEFGQQQEHTFNILADVMEANSVVASVQLTVVVFRR